MILVLAACGETRPDESESTGEAGGAATPVRADTGLIQNTPEGGVLDWVADIQAGLDSIPAVAARDPAAAQSQVLNLYVTRQEYLEMYYGPGGRLEVSGALAGTIEAAESRFHALMQELAGEAPDPATIMALTDSLSAQVAEVRGAAEALGRELTPWTRGSS